MLVLCTYDLRFQFEFVFLFFLMTDTLDNNKNDDESNSISSFFQMSEVRLYTVIGLIIALVAVALLQATCTIYKTSKSRRNQKVCFASTHLHNYRDFENKN